ncbi:hypothetical protein DIPPA_19511 [Diplonema papillatum]|nr:hypothetical protein DIPPA_19511 [Diplonema papillatum]
MADDEDSGNETASDRGSVVSGVSGMDTDAESSGEDAEEEEAKAAPVSDRPPAIGGWGQRTVVAKRKVDAPAGGGAAKRQKLDETVGLSAVGGIMEQARLATLQREAGADAFNAQGHAALVKFLEPHFQNEAVAPVLRAARERFCEHCTLGPKQWALWIAHEKLLGDETLPRKQYVLQLLQKANEDFLCVRLLVEQCEYLNEVLELSLEVNQRADDDEEDAKRVESVRNQYEQALQRGGLDFEEAHLLWQSYREFWEEEEEDEEKLLVVTANLFKRQLAVPHAAFGETLAAFETWAGAQAARIKANSEAQKLAASAKRASALAQGLLADREAHEKAVAPGKGKKDRDAEKAWLEYIGHEDGPRAVTLCERAVAAVPSSVKLWLKLGKLHGQSTLVRLRCASRAVRSLPRNPRVWLELLRCAELLAKAPYTPRAQLPLPSHLQGLHRQEAPGHPFAPTPAAAAADLLRDAVALCVDRVRLRARRDVHFVVAELASSLRRVLSGSQTAADPAEAPPAGEKEGKESEAPHSRVEGSPPVENPHERQQQRAPGPEANAASPAAVREACVGPLRYWVARFAKEGDAEGAALVLDVALPLLLPAAPCGDEADAAFSAASGVLDAVKKDLLQAASGGKPAAPVLAPGSPSDDGAQGAVSLGPFFQLYARRLCGLLDAGVGGAPDEKARRARHKKVKAVFKSGCDWAQRHGDTAALAALATEWLAFERRHGSAADVDNVRDAYYEELRKAGAAQLAAAQVPSAAEEQAVLALDPKRKEKYDEADQKWQDHKRELGLEGPTGPQELTAFLWNIPFSCEDGDVGRFLQGINIKGVRLIKGKNGIPKGFGYVDVNDEADLQRVLAFDKKKLGGRQVRIQRADPNKLAKDGEADEAKKLIAQREKRQKRAMAFDKGVPLKAQADAPAGNAAAPPAAVVPKPAAQGPKGNSFFKSLLSK